MAGKRKPKKVSRKEQKSQKRIQGVRDYEASLIVQNNTPTDDKPVVIKDKKIVELPKIITVREFAETLGLPVTTVIGELMKNGIMASINESIDFETASIVGDELGFEAKLLEEIKEQEKKLTADEIAKLKPRPPVVVVLGHVDHGKTTLLDQIRKADVVSTESGGITQHIGAYQVKLKTKKEKLKANEERSITFLDTPGHEAFSAMRAHGANITDIAILVVAADDGVKPQTKEAISHAKAAEIPIIVAINKIDKPGADIERVKRELADQGLNPEEWGGKTVMVPISAKQGEGIDELLELLLVTADLEELKANPDTSANGVVIESHMQAGMGPVATVLVQEGTLRTGDIAVIGDSFGRVRRMEDYQGKIITQAQPSTPVRVAGIKEIVGFGEKMFVVDNEKEANLKVQSRSLRLKKLGLYEFSEKVKSGELEQFNIVIKADVQGSIEAIRTSLNNLSSDKIKVKIIHEAVGDITESDVNLAISSEALVIGFRTKPTIAAKNLAQIKEVKISTYDIIYQLIDDITSALLGLVKPEFIEVSVGKLEVLKVFHSTKDTKIIGGKVVDGKMIKGAMAHHFHSGDKTGDGKITTLQMEQNPVAEVDKGFECGLGFDIASIIKPGDLIEAYEMQEVVSKS
ncbi:MAG: hypothetical protein ACD_58C00031G0001 [uncultured bacterium]|nr:MAG: hypothetical protein ACD_58C00031G0001 [uncultured bacterium]